MREIIIGTNEIFVVQWQVLESSDISCKYDTSYIDACNLNVFPVLKIFLDEALRSNEDSHLLTM